MKKCVKCGIEKELTEFHKHKKQKDGLRTRCKTCRKEDYQDNRENILEQQKEYYKNNRESRLEYVKEYQKNNKEKLMQYQLEYQKERCQNDPTYKMIRNYRKRTREAYHKASAIKTQGTMELLGCSGEQLKEHLEKQFQPGMTHENYGEWHIDHIRPCSSFDLSDPKQEQACFHYTNLQPLWAQHNLSKGAKY